MTETMNRIVLASRPTGAATLENFRYEEAPLPQPGPGEFLVRTIWLSLDPYMRGRMNAAKSYAEPAALNETMTGGCVAEVIGSRHSGFMVGDIVVCPIGWASHGLSEGRDVLKVDQDAAPISTALGVLGMPGMTAWYGLNEIAQAKSGETIVVSAATGAVGSLVGQLAKLKGMRVIGVAGGAEKCSHATDVLGYDVCLDHRALNAAELAEQFGKAAPDGVDVYYENVGGKTLEAVLPNMNTHGRIAVCGIIAWYQAAAEQGGMSLPAVWGAILRQRLRVQGFIIFDHYDHFPEFLEEVAPLVRDGSIVYQETIAEGLKAAPDAFLNMLHGHNLGKQLVRVGEDPA